ncbi:MAG: acetate uptake transporter [Syntrophobacteraceae bacterium]
MSEHKLANPGPWAVLAFATTSFMLGVYNAGLLPGGGVPIVVDVALIFGGLMQIIVGILEFTAGNTFTTAVFGSYGPFWVAFGGLELFFAKMIPAAALSSAIALFLAMFGVLTFIFFIASLKTDWVLIIIFALIFVTFVVLTIGAATGVGSWNVLGGWLTIIFAVLAWYHAAAGIIAFTWGREVLPLGKIQPAAPAKKAALA